MKGKALSGTTAYLCDLPSVDPTNTFPMELTYHPNSPTAYLEHNIPK